MTYLSCKASPYAWQEILSDLTIFGPQQWLSDKAICRFLMDIWWPLRHEPQAGCAYLPLLTVHEISMAIGKRGRDSIGSHVGFQDGPFYSQYSSVIPQLPHRRVGFVLIRNLGSMQVATDSWTHVINNPNHFFTVVFDYDSQRAHSFGVSGRQTTGALYQTATESDWNRWYGPELWMDLAYHLGWEGALQPLERVHVVSKDWEQVIPLIVRSMSN